MRYFSKIKILMVISMLLFNSFALAAANLPNFTEVVKITKESVVNINTTQTIKKRYQISISLLASTHLVILTYSMPQNSIRNTNQKP